MCSPLKGFLLIVPLKATKDKRRFRFHLRGVPFVSAVWCTPRRSSQRYDAHHGDHLSYVMHTAEVCMVNTYIMNELFWNIKCYNFFYLCGVQHTADIISGVCSTLQRLSLRYNAHGGDHFVIEYLGENKTENTSGCLSGAQMGSNHEKIGVENLVTHSL